MPLGALVCKVVICVLVGNTCCVQMYKCVVLNTCCVQVCQTVMFLWGIAVVYRCHILVVSTCCVQVKFLWELYLQHLYA